MRKQALVPVILVVLAVAGLMIPLVSAQSRTPQTTDSNSTASSPDGDETITYHTSPQQHSNRNVVGEDILLIQTNDPWERESSYIGGNWYDGVTADTKVLDTLGYAYRIATWNDIESGAVNIFAFPVVLIVNDQVQAFYDEYASHVSEFESYVSSGHTLVFFAAGGGWARGELNAPLPGGVQWNYTDWNTGAAYRNVVVDSSHPIVSAELSDSITLGSADLYNNKASHGHFTALPSGSRIILRESVSEGGRPTLVDYPLGNGRVVASTLTWEHNWAHWGGSQYGYFAQKALDDVFLYAFSGGTVPADVKIELRIEDAPTWKDVNKSPGSYVDIVARVSGDSPHTANVVLQIPANKLGTPTKTFTRVRPGDPVAGQEDQYTDLGSGRYQITSQLQSQSGQYYKELIWRFRIPDGVQPEQGIEVTASLSIPGHTVQQPTSTARLNIIDYARSIIVTNRRLLFDKYQPSPAQNDVSPLLEEVYIQASAYNGEVFYVDLYDHSARNWNQNVDYKNESTANTVAIAIDDLLDSWYERLTKKPHWWETIRPEFLLIVGGDEIIPFYRVDDRPYGDDEHKYNVHVDSQDPVGRVPEEHYFLSDNIYADVGGDKEEWEKGELELSYGRILGHSASAMHDFMENARLETPPLKQAVMASRSSDHNLDTIRDRLNARHVDVYGESSPDLTENDKWTRAQWVTALEQPFQVMAFQGHGAYDGWYGTDGWGINGVTAANHPAGKIEQNHPLFAVEACNFAIPSDLDGATWNPEADDNISYRLISLGAGGLLSSTAIDSTRKGNKIAYGERLHNDYFRYLIDESSWLGLVQASAYSEYWGTALLDAKQNYPGNGFPWGYNDTDKKTLQGYVYYGLPWSFMATPDNALARSLVDREEEGGYDVSLYAPQETSANTYSRVIETIVGSHQFTAVDGYELLEIPGSESLYSLYKPVLPVLYTTLDLPPGSSVLGIELLDETAKELGIHNIPAADPPSQYNPTTGYTSVMDISGVYPPAPRFGYNIKDFGDRVEVRIAIAPATFDIDTKHVTLYEVTTLKVDYSAPVPAAISPIFLDSPIYQVGEDVSTFAEVENVGASSITLTGKIALYDETGSLIGTTSSIPFVVNGGESHTLQIPWTEEMEPGNYRLTMTVEQAGAPQVAANKAFGVLAGRITSFAVPATLGYDEYGGISVAFDNYRFTPVNAAAKVFVYNAAGVEVASLLQRTFSVGAGESGSTSWSWNPAGLPPGTYTLRATVQIGDEVYTSETRDMRVGEPDQNGNYLPAIFGVSNNAIIVPATHTPTTTPTTMPASTATSTPSSTSSPSPTNTPVVPTHTSTPTASQSPTASPTPTASQSPTASPTPTASPSPTPSATPDTPFTWQPAGVGAASGSGISDTPTDSTRPSLAYSPDGFIYIAWAEYKTKDNGEIFVRRWNGSSWTEVGAGSASGSGISGTAGSSDRPRIAAASDGTLYVTWEEAGASDSEIFVKKWNGSSWIELADSASAGGVSNTSGESELPSVAVAADGTAYVAWQEGTFPDNEIYVRRWSGTAWEEVGTNSASAGGISNNSGDSGSPSVTVVGNTPFIGWTDVSGGPDTEVYIRRWNGSSWTEAGSGSASGGGISNNVGASRGPDLAADSAGNVYAIWPDNTGGISFNIYAKRWNGVKWEDIGAGSASGGGISQGGTNAIAPEIAIGTDDIPYATWYVAVTDEVYVRRWNAGNWEEAGVGSASGGGLSNNSGASNHSTVAVGLGNIPYVAWADDTSGNFEIYAKRWVE